MEKKVMRTMLFTLMVLICLSGCSAPKAEQNLQQTYTAQTLQSQYLIETIVAQTLSAIDLRTTPQQPTPTIPVPSFTPPITATSDPTVASTNTPTANALVMVEVSVPTNCRTGPGKVFDRVSVLDVKIKAEVIGRNASESYWIIKKSRRHGLLLAVG